MTHFCLALYFANSCLENLFFDFVARNYLFRALVREVFQQPRLITALVGNPFYTASLT